MNHLERMAENMESIGALTDAVMLRRAANEAKARILDEMASNIEKAIEETPALANRNLLNGSATLSQRADIFRQAAALFRKQDNIEWVPSGKTEMVAHYKGYWLSCHQNTWQVFAVTKTSLMTGRVRFDEDPKGAAVAWVDEKTKGMAL